MNHDTRSIRWPLLATLVLAAAATLPAHAQRALRDPLTGELRAPTAEELKRLQEVERRLEAARQAQRPATAAPRLHRLRDGSDLLEHDDSMLNYTVVRRGADGSLRAECVTGAELAARSAGQPASFAKNPMEQAYER